MEKECPRCKRKFGEEVELECPFCGTLVSPKLDRCPCCEIDYHEFADRAEEQLWQKALDSIVKEIEDLRTETQAGSEIHESALTPPTPHEAPEEAEAEEALCPVCQRVVFISDAVCPGCGAEFEDEGDIYDETLAVCPMCGETVSYETAVCPSCGAEFEDEGEPEGLGEATTAPQGPPTKATGIRAATDEGGGLVAKTPAARIHAGSGLSNGLSVTNGSGIINGRAQTNGIPFVNGRDIVNGTGLVRVRGGRREQKLPIYLRWQVIAILVAVAIITPSYLQLSNPGDEGPYSIDGDFGDWDGATMFSVTTVSPDIEPDVVEWSTATHGEHVYLYVRMSQEAMAGMRAQRVVLFIDSDDSPSSGYSVGGVGADYMMELFGWNGSVKTSTISRFQSTQGQLDWDGWAVSGPAESMLTGERLEARAKLIGGPSPSSKFILAVQDEERVNCISHPVALSGGVLIIEQGPTEEVLESEIVSRGTSIGILRLRFSCQGSGGNVETVTPTLSGITSFEQVQPFSLAIGEERLVELRADTSGLMPGQFVSASVSIEDVVSDFATIKIVGDPVRTYAESPPSGISIDGAFADWENLTTKDFDSVQVTNKNIDIDSVGANTTSEEAFFFVSVYGKICAGTYIPQGCVIPSGQGGGTVVPTRRTAEDFIRVYIDSDRSRASGHYVAIGTMTIGADYMVEVRGLCREIVSSAAYRYDGGGWVATTSRVDAAKDASRMEIGLPSSAIGGNSDINFIIETTDWSGEKDQATDENYGHGVRTWAIDSSSTSTLATDSSNQRKIFNDGSSLWSIYFDGSNTVYAYSTDGGVNWNTVGNVFKTSGVRTASLWYDPEEEVVYVIGDTSSSSTTVRLQRGEVDTSTREITWAASDTNKAVTSQQMPNKNSFISKDSNGYLWIMATNQTQTGPTKYNLKVWKSTNTDDITSWESSWNVMTEDGTSPEAKGAILPAGSGSDVWAVYNFDSTVAARKYSGGSWGSQEVIYAISGSYDFITTAPASAVVDTEGVVHVVYGDGTKSGSNQRPHIKYTYRNADGWASPITLDDSDDSVGQKNPTISLDKSTGNVYAVWIQNDNNHIVWKKNVSGAWSSATRSDTTAYTKAHLTAIYSVTSESDVCWQWTQNSTGTIEVMFDEIPEFQDFVLPVLMIIAMFAIISRRTRARAKNEQ